MQSKFYGAVPTTLPAGIVYLTLKDQLELSPNMTASCIRLVGETNTWGKNMLRRIQVRFRQHMFDMHGTLSERSLVLLCMPVLDSQRVNE